eukprot:scaffold3114_cov114-Isochrysis_galbana.AAC.16
MVVGKFCERFARLRATDPAEKRRREGAVSKKGDHDSAFFSFSHVASRPAWPPGAPHGGGPAGRDTETLATPAFSQPACCPKPLKLQCPLRHQLQIDIDNRCWQAFWQGPPSTPTPTHPWPGKAGGRRKAPPSILVLPRFPGILSTHNPTLFPCPMLSTHMVSHTTCCKVVSITCARTSPVRQSSDKTRHGHCFCQPLSIYRGVGNPIFGLAWSRRPLTRAPLLRPLRRTTSTWESSRRRNARVTRDPAHGKHGEPKGNSEPAARDERAKARPTPKVGSSLLARHKATLPETEGQTDNR